VTRRLLMAMLAVSPLALAANLGALRADEVALWAAPVEGRTVFDEHRADAAMNPASTMKLVTAWAALNRLGPGYRWRSELKSTAVLENGVLRGDLYWIGRGDPRFDSARLTELLRQLRLRGVQRIDGRLLLDKRAFSRIGSADGFDGDAERVFSVPPDTHLSNLKVAWLRYFYEQGRPQVVLDPPLPGFRLDNRLQPGSTASCGDVREHAEVSISGSSIRVSGKLPPACDGAASYVNVLDNDGYAAQSFAAIWQQLGGEGPRGVAQGDTPPDARQLVRLDSEPLPQALNDINKYSNNTMARSVWLTLGAENPHSGDTVADAQLAVRSLLLERGIAAEPLQLENGAGLSRRERISARQLGAILLDAARGPYAAEFIASLPLAGEDGTLRRRFAGLGPRLRLKTGTLGDTRALAGYWQAPSGQRLAIVALLNSARAAQLQGALDALVGEVVERYAAQLQGQP